MSGNRSEAISYQQMLDREQVTVPESLRLSTDTDLGSAPISVDRYLTREYYEREVEELWPRVWQAVCRETEIGEVGDYYTHDIASYSVLVVRQQDGGIKGFMNACLHRGRPAPGISSI